MPEGTDAVKRDPAGKRAGREVGHPARPPGGVDADDAGSGARLEGVDVVDSQGAAKLAEILDYAESMQIELRLARVKPAIATVLARDGVLDRLGPDRIHGNVNRAVEAQLAADRLAGQPERSPGADH